MDDSHHTAVLMFLSPLQWKMKRVMTENQMNDSALKDLSCGYAGHAFMNWRVVKYL
jgi:hypothetical protein